MGLYLEARVGTCEDDIEGIIKRYNPKSVPYPFGRLDVKKYGYAVNDGNNFRLVTISQYSGNILEDECPEDKYNVIVTVHGTDQAQVIKQMRDLERRLGIFLYAAPESFKQHQQAILNMFESCKF